MHRRRYLETVTVCSLASAAGCTSFSDDDPEDDTDTRTDDPEDTVPHTPVTERDLSQRLGAAHVASTYRFHENELDLLNEGASVLEGLGCRVFKGWLYNLDREYPYTDWPQFDTLVETIQHESFQELLDREFDTYVFNSTAPTSSVDQGGFGYFVHGFDDEQAREVEEQCYDLTEYLLETYDDRGTEFVLKNWEGDWILAGGGGEDGPLQRTVLDRGKRWWSARQRGIQKARSDIESDAAVFGCCEINRVIEAKDDDIDWIVNTILSELEVDLVSYSAWDLCRRVADHGRLDDDARAIVHETLQYIETQSPEPNDYVEAVLGSEAKPVFVGEYGLPKRRAGIDPAMRAIRGTTEESLAWGCPYVIFWQTYDNELWIDGERVGSASDPNIEDTIDEELDGHPGNEDVFGFHLIRPDGRRASAWYYFAELVETRTGDFVRVDIDFEDVPLESDLNPAVPEEHSRHLGLFCYEIAVSDGANTVAFDVGSLDDEVAFGGGVYAPESPTGSERARWLGGPDKRTTFYVHLKEAGLDGPLTELELDGAAAEDGLDATVLVDGESVESVSLVDGRVSYRFEI